MRKRRTGALVAASCSLGLVTASPAQASVIWDGDAGQGTGVFSSTLCDSPGSVVAQDNNDGRGQVFKFNKPLGLERCEAHGIRVGGSRYTFRNDSTYWIGWDTSTNTPDAGTIFQWKSYGTGDQHQQNYPVLMKVEGGRLKLFHIEPGENWTLKWSTPVATSTYKRIVLGIHTSDEASTGWVAAFYNGTKVAEFSGRTWDDLGNDTRFGTYGAEVKDKRVINWIDGLKVGTEYGDVD
ncbi:heparin lyase I family protein [Streptomyces luteolus]|uniref:Heparin lyase I family protein n=1 Tax=Streptomyces luteolus TaxID=3043615 RepID=A0ABT6SPH1_9ACTN|nr:heparin lyase I family protein [Streptomyces sp. B-S-A12]MDI3417517.1 heparin lyase I family protein [Streptomyces sp. B-S-A12]